MTVLHSQLTGADLHEPKGIDTALAGEVYVADGAGSGSWEDTSVAESIWVYHETLTPSAVANIDTSSLSAYRNIRLTLTDFRPASSTVLKMQFSTNGSSYSDLSSGTVVYAPLTSTETLVSSPYPAGNLNILSGTSSSGGLNAIIHIWNFNQAKVCHAVSVGACNTTFGHYMFRGGFAATGTTARSHIRFLFTTGNITAGRVIVEGQI